jgi:hypothetical protein
MTEYHIISQIEKPFKSQIKVLENKLLNHKENKYCTIYLLTNTHPEGQNKKYVGQTWNGSENRMGKEGSSYSNSTYLYNAIQRYGAEYFVYTDLIGTQNQAYADELEDYFMILYETLNHEKGYNLKRGGVAGKHTEATKAKISATLKAQAAEWTDEERARRAAPISTYWLGKERGPHTEEWKEANSEMMIKRHAEQGHPMQGKTHTEEAKAKQSAASKKMWASGTVMTPEVIKKRSQKRMMDKDREANILLAYKNGDEIATIEKNYKTGRSSIYRIIKRNKVKVERSTGSAKGERKDTEESKLKMSEAKKADWAKRKNTQT